MPAHAITLQVYEENGVYRAECEFPVVHAVGDSEDEAIERAATFIREMLAEADPAMMPEMPSTLIIRVERDGNSAIIMQPLSIASPAPGGEAG